MYRWYRALVLSGLLAGLIVLLVRIIPRLLFPYDMLSYAESPLLTDMFKLEHDGRIYAPISDANSFVYVPGMEVLNYSILRLLGLTSSIAAHRVLQAIYSVGVGAMCAYVGSLFRFELGKRTLAATVAAASVFVLTTFAAFLFSYTPHPDVLHALVVFGLFALTLVAMRRASFSLAVAVVAISSLAIFVKQVAVLTPVACALALTLSRRFELRQCLVFLGFLPVIAICQLGVFWRVPYMADWTIHLLSKHQVQVGKIPYLLKELFLDPIFGILWIVAGVRFWLLYRKPDNRILLNVWLVFFVFAGLPCVSAYLKVNGFLNNLSVIRMFPAILAIDWLCEALLAQPQGSVFRRAAGFAVAAVFVVQLAPSYDAPHVSMKAHCEAIEDVVRRAVSKKKRILVGHGTSFLRNANVPEVPLDRANTALELSDGGFSGRYGIYQRLQTGYYDYIIVNTMWYDEQTFRLIWMNYHPIERIPPAKYVRDFQFLMNEATVYARNGASDAI